jgi:NAD-dependent dihydropyrimidine dehydrogenase PreA subunit
MRPRNPPPAEYAFRFRNQPLSGNIVNGLNETERRRPRPVFHSSGRGGGRQPLDWEALDVFFNLVAPFATFVHVIKGLWQRRLYAGPVARRRVDLDSTDATRRVKSHGKKFGAGLVGISKLTEEALYEGYPEPGYRYVISLGIPMDREEMKHVPQLRAGAEVMRTYRQGSMAAIRLARYIRSLGWPAQAFADGDDILQIPMAVNSGLGQLGKHGSLISREFGSNFRLASVLTDLPLDCDRPVNIGVDELCTVCRRCTKDCPPGAIIDVKQTVRGQQKWYVDFDKCVPYFSITQGCAICLEVCPWSKPGRGESLAEKFMSSGTSV